MYRKLAGILGLTVVLAHGAAAADFPDGPVRIVVPAAAGGGLDIVVRALTPILAERWKQPVIVDNRPGAGGSIGAGVVANAKADGLTLLAAQDQIMVANRFLYKTLPYDPESDFAPVAMMVQANQLVLATPKVPANDLKELVDYVKAGKGRFFYGSYGAGSTPHLAFELLNKREGLELTHVPYKGVAPVLTGMMSDEVQLSFGSAAVAGNLIDAGKLKPLAVASRERDPSLPSVKTTTELGMPWLQVSIWHSLFAPKGTPSEIVEKIAADVQLALKSPEFSTRTPGFVILDGGPQELAKRNREEVERAREMVESANITPQ